MSCSYIDMPADKVREMAEKCLKHIRDRRARDWADTIASRRRSYERSWIRRLLRLRVPTDEEIREQIKADYWSSTFIDAYAWASEATAKKLLLAAENAVSGKVVHVSAEDLDMIGGV